MIRAGIVTTVAISAQIPTCPSDNFSCAIALRGCARRIPTILTTGNSKEHKQGKSDKIFHIKT
jgi:hypothetical protein